MITNLSVVDNIEVRRANVVDAVMNIETEICHKFFNSFTGILFRISSDFCFNLSTLVKPFLIMSLLNLGNKKKSYGVRFGE